MYNFEAQNKINDNIPNKKNWNNKLMFPYILQRT